MNNKRIYPILLIIFTNILGAGVIIPILPLYAEGEFAGTVTQITLLSTAFFGAQFIAAPILGRLSDQYGRRPILIISQIGTVLAFMLFIFAAPLGRIIDGLGWSLPLTGGMVMLFIARILDGITGGNITTAQAYVSDITDDDTRAEGLGLLQAAFGVGFIFGPAFGGILGNFGVTMPFIGATVITIGTLLLTVFTLEESLPHEARSMPKADGQGKKALPLSEALAEPTLMMILVIGFVASLGFAAIPAIFSLFTDNVIFAESAHPERVQLYIGLMLTFMGLMQVITQVGVLKPLILRFGERRALLLGQLGLIFSYFGFAIVANPWMLTLLLAPFAFGQGVSEPSLQALVTRFGTLGNSGQLLGLYQSARSMAMIVGPIWAGIAYELISPRAAFAIGGGIAIMAFFFGLALQRMPLPEKRTGQTVPAPMRPQ
jgi:DHA1 family tetracycline resistance protein-like MFS transporter